MAAGANAAAAAICAEGIPEAIKVLGTNPLLVEPALFNIARISGKIAFVRELRALSTLAPVHRACMPFACIKEPARRALVARLMSIEALEAIFVVGARPAPRMHRTTQNEPEQVQPFHYLGAPARSFTQDLLTESGVDGKKLCSCHR